MAAKDDTSHKKRKHKKSKSKEKSWREDQDNYYERLLHSSQKALRKTSKLVRNLESQKLVRKIKERKSRALEENYEQLKRLDLENVVQESLRRLGILYLNPKLEREATEEKSTKDDEGVGEDGQKPDSVQKSKEINQKEKELIERILKHKKMQSALEEWNEKVTEYRRWSLAQQEKESRPKFLEGSNTAMPSKKKKRKVEEQSSANASADDPEKSLFVCLGEEEADADMPHYGPGSFPEEKKKNRMGQRQRKAKQMAVEAKKAGRAHRAADSVNWRKKKAPDARQNDKSGNMDKADSSRGSQPGRNDQATVAPESLHPSWAAAKKETTGIVQFQGKKITFD